MVFIPVGQRCLWSENADTLLSLHEHHWDSDLTDHVPVEFELVCLRRLKGMVSTVRRSGKQPKWITGTVWKQLRTLWQTKRSNESRPPLSSKELSRSESNVILYL